ncbi:TolC family protein [Rhodanobacter ginsengiterrae]|uniref:TolC family protein n=1 Tax=Rhodanobacter ginsengiterrae TaxID=2008451 RepID=UPI003CE9C65E
MLHRLTKAAWSNRWRTWLSVTAFTMLAGCAAPLPRLTPPIPPQWQHQIARDQAQPTDLHGWWHAFNDATLDALVERSVAGNLDLAQAAERLRAVRVMHASSGARYLPSLRASTNDVIDPDASASYFLVGFDASWELGLFGRAEGTRREAQGQLDAGIADLRATRVTLVAEVAREWINLRTAQQQEQLLLRISASRRHALQLAQTRQQLQLAAPDATDRAQVALAQAESALIAPREAINASAWRLAVLLGQNHPDPSWLQAGPPPELGNWEIDSTPANLLRSRPEIARAEADVLSAAGELATAHADRFPRIGLGGSINWSTDINNNHRRSTTPNAIAAFGPEISIPLFDWGIRLAAENARDHQLKASVLAYRQAVLQGVAEVETALGSVQQQRLREQHSRQAWQALQRVDQSTQKRAALQLASPLDRNESRLAVDQAALDLADARAGHDLAYVALFKALGGAPLPASGDPDETVEVVPAAGTAAKARH